MPFELTDAHVIIVNSDLPDTSRETLFYCVARRLSANIHLLFFSQIEFVFPAVGQRPVYVYIQIAFCIVIPATGEYQRNMIPLAITELFP